MNVTCMFFLSISICEDTIHDAAIAIQNVNAANNVSVNTAPVPDYANCVDFFIFAF